MATQLEIVRLIAPEFAAVSDEDVLAFLDLAPLYIDPELVPEDRRGLALALQACILMSMQAQSSTGSATAGPVTREKEGDLERSYGYSSNSTAEERKNGYQKQLDALYRGIIAGSITMRYGLTG
jgi:hypothetical protein